MSFIPVLHVPHSLLVRLRRTHGAAVRLASRATLLLVALAACSSEGGRAGGNVAASNDLLIVAYDREPDTLNRFSTHILEDVQTCVVEGLVTTDERMQVIPLLAAEIPTPENGGVVMRADGGMDVTWKLRPGVKWHDGVPFTSADVKFTVDAINSPDYNPESTDGFDRIASVDTPDSLTAVVHYKEPYAPYEIQFIRGTLPKHVLEGKDIDAATEYNRNPLGTGPYRVAEWKTGEYILLEKVPDYWRGAEFPKIARVLFKFIPNTTTRINQLKSGEAHIAALVPWDKYRELKEVPGLTIHQMMGNSYEHITLNQKAVPAFGDVRVRRALVHAIDRELLSRTVLDGLAPVIHGAIQPLSWAFTDSVMKYPYDTTRARALLEEAGWRDTDGDGVREREGVPLRFTLITQAGFAIRESISQAVQRQWRDVGVDIKIQLIDGTSISSLWFDGKFDAMLHWWHMPSDPEITLFFASDRTPPRGRNINFVADDSLDRLMYASDRTVAQEPRKALLVAAQQRLAELVPEIPLYNVTRLDAVPSTLRNFKGNPTNAGIFWNVWEWEVTEP